jgi:ATP-dependent RNA helicase DeaD
MSFQEMNLNTAILRALDEMGIETPTEIQARAIPKVIGSSTCHIFAQAKTGTGKTLSYAIPLAEKLNPELQQVQAVILVPTRELCRQVYDVFSDLTKYRQLKVVEVYGGVSMEPQIRKIQQGAQIVVATPGRLIDLYERRDVTFDSVQFVALDEADRMLDMGFYPDIEFLLLTAMQRIRPRLMLFSATLLDQIKELVKKFTSNKDVVEVNVSHDTLTVDNCSQFYYLVEDRRDKYYDFVRVLRQERPKYNIIFVNTKKTAEWLYDRLREEKGLSLRIDLIEGDLSQKRRENVLDAFRNQKINTLIATDVAARGLDIPGITHVFNYDVPQFAENYVHRIGRTSRMEREGTAITMCLKDQYNFLCRIEGFMKKNIVKKPLPSRNGGNSGGGHSGGGRPQGPHHNSPQKSSDREFRPDRRNFLY